MDFRPHSLCQKKTSELFLTISPFFGTVFSLFLWSLFSSDPLSPPLLDVRHGSSVHLLVFVPFPSCPSLYFPNHPLIRHLSQSLPFSQFPTRSAPIKLNLFTLPLSFPCASRLSLLKSSVAFINPSTFSPAPSHLPFSVSTPVCHLPPLFPVLNDPQPEVLPGMSYSEAAPLPDALVDHQLTEEARGASGGQFGRRGVPLPSYHTWDFGRL